MRFIQTMSAVATLCAASSAALAQTSPAPAAPTASAAPAQAASIMRKAYRQAKEAKKPVLLVFGATW
jgi:hypothetical protein